MPLHCEPMSAWSPSTAEELVENAAAIGPEHQHHTHQRASGHHTRSHRQGELFGELWFQSLEQERNEGAQEEQKPIIQGNTQARPNADAEGRCSWYFGNKTGARVSSTPTTPPANISHSLIDSSEDRPCPSAMATADQVWAAGAGNWSVPSTCALGTRTANVSTVTTVPTKMPENWARNC